MQARAPPPLTQTGEVISQVHELCGKRDNYDGCPRNEGPQRLTQSRCYEKEHR